MVEFRVDVRIFLALGQILLILPSCRCWPIHPALLTVERSPGEPDYLIPALCPSKCKVYYNTVHCLLITFSIQERWNARQAIPSEGHCACACPPEAPLFLYTDSSCVKGMGRFIFIDEFYKTNNPTVLLFIRSFENNTSKKYC